MEERGEGTGEGENTCMSEDDKGNRRDVGDKGEGSGGHGTGTERGRGRGGGGEVCDVGLGEVGVGRTVEEGERKEMKMNTSISLGPFGVI